MKKLNKPFTVTLDYQPSKSLNISFSDGEIIAVKSFKISKDLKEKDIIKQIKVAAKEIAEKHDNNIEEVEDEISEDERPL